MSGQPDLGFEWGGSPTTDGVLYAAEGESSPMVRYRLHLTDTSGLPLPTDSSGNPQVAVGQTFRLWGYNQDVRSPETPKGVFAAYMDVFYTNASLITIRYGETQKLQFVYETPLPGEDAPDISGQFKLTFDGQTTPFIPYDAAALPSARALLIQQALEGLSNVGPGNVRVSVEPVSSGTPVTSDAFRVQFLKNLGERDVPMIGVDHGGLINCQDAFATDLYPADPTHPGTFRTSFTAVDPFINAARAVDKADLEAGQENLGGRTFGGVGGFMGLFNSPGPTALLPFFYVDLKAVGAGTVAFSGNPSNTDVAPYEETDTLVFPSDPEDDKLVVESYEQTFYQDISHPLVLNIVSAARDDIIGRANSSGQWLVAKSTGTSFVNQIWGGWSPINWNDVRVGDVNGDGRADIVGRTDWGDWWVAKANDTGTGFVNERWGFWSPINWLDVQVADVNGDGRADIVGRADGGDWWVAKANDTGTGFINERWGFWSPITWLDVQVADVSGDGRADIVGRTEWGDWWVAKANDTGTGFVNERWGFWSPVTWLDVHAADVSGDGRADIVGRTEWGDWWVAKPNGTGTGFLMERWGFWSPIPWADVRVADVSGDGRADIVGRVDYGDWWVAKANDTGTGFINERWGFWSPITWLDVQAADVSGDGRADIVGRTEWGDWWVAKTNDTGTGSVNEQWGHWDPGIWSDVHAADVTGQDAAPALMALAAPPSEVAADPLSAEQLALVFEQAVQQWETVGLAAAQLALFRDVQVAIADLPGLQLGLATSSVIVLDLNAAGYGWYVEAGPQSPEVPALQMDLLTAVVHELGHLAGLPDEYVAADSTDVMSGWLLPGTRRLPTLADLDAVFEDSDWSET